MSPEIDQALRQPQGESEKYTMDLNNHSDDNINHQLRRASIGEGTHEIHTEKKNLTAIQATIIFITNEIGIGILSLPAALRVLGLFPGILCIIVMGLLSLYSAYNLIQYWRKYPHIVSIVDYGRVLGGPWVESIFAIGFLLNMALICGSAVITISIGLNTISEHGACTIVFTTVATLAMWALCVPRTMKFVAYCGWPCTVSIVSAVMIVMVSLGVAGPQYPGLPLNIQAVGNPTFTQATSAFLNVAFAFSGNQAFPTVLAEMKDPSRDFPKAIVMEKSFTICMYIIVAITCYCLAGEQVTSPAIGSAPITAAKVSYGIIFVSLLGTGLVFGHTATKYIHIAWMRHFHFFGLGKANKTTDHADEAQLKHNSTGMPQSRAIIWATWLIVVTAFWVIVWIIANAIPIFDSLLNISASLLLAWFTWGIPVLLWFHLNWNGQWRSSSKKIALTVLNAFILVVVIFMNTGGMYASVANMLSIFADPTSSVNGPFTCSDNSIL